MPKDYEAVRDSLRKQHPDWSLEKVKRQAAKITNSRRKKAGKPAARFHGKRKKKGS